MVKQRGGFELVKLTKEECEAIEDWLLGHWSCIDTCLAEAGAKPNGCDCKLCIDVFFPGLDPILTCGYTNCPCNRLGAAFVVDTAVTLLEYNGYELSYQPSRCDVHRY